MAQSSISSYYRTRKRTGEPEGILSKKRKVEDHHVQSSCSPFIEVPSDSRELVTTIQEKKKTTRKTRTTKTKRTQSTSNRRRTKNAPRTTLESLIPSAIETRGTDGGSLSVDTPKTPTKVTTNPPKTVTSKEPATDDNRPVKFPTPVKTRAALMLEMAMKKSGTSKDTKTQTPSKLDLATNSSSSLSRESVRRKLLTESCELPTTKDVKKIRSMSARELAQPTSFEKNSSIPKLSGLKGFHVTSPVKVSPRKPAHQRFQSLAETAPDEVWDLPLSQKYLLLAEKFKCMDLIVNMLQQRGETCTFQKLKLAVEEMLRRSFDVKNVGQVKEVYPSAFHFKQEKHIPGHYDREMYKQYQLTVMCNVEETGTDQPAEPAVSSSGFKYLASSSLLQRRRIFRKRLVKITKDHHKEFLNKLNIVLSEDQVRRWHVDFPLESVSDVHVAALPEPPAAEEISSAKEVLSRIRPNTRCNQDGEHCDSKEPLEESGDQLAATSGVQQSGVLKGVPLGLLEKIKKREAEKLKQEMMRDCVTQRTIDILSRLPSFCRILKSHFVSAKKAAIPLEDVTQKLLDSHGSAIDREFLNEHVNVLLVTLPQWVKKVKIGKVEYVKLLNKNMDVKAIDVLLEARQKELIKTC